MISYAQNCEDVLLWRAFKHIKKGFYVDIGAADPVRDSVTKWFYDQGWTGINIEPNEDDFRSLTIGRPRDINLQVAVGPQTGPIKFFLNETKGWSSVSPETAKKAHSLGRRSKEYQVNSIPLLQILLQYAPPVIHFMKIDVEGYEEEVLKSCDFEKFRPWVLIVEFADLEGNYGDPQKAFPILLRQKYILAAFDGLNLFFVANEHSRLKEALQKPVSVFDEFKLFTITDLERQRKELTEIAQKSQAQCEELKADLSLQKSEANKRSTEIAIIHERNKEILKQNRRLNYLLRQLKLILFVANPFVFAASRSIWKNELLGIEAKPSINLLRHVAVDLTPLLPGGQNGGAKVFVLELIRQMAQCAPETTFYLFTKDMGKHILTLTKLPNVVCWPEQTTAGARNDWWTRILVKIKEMDFLNEKEDCWISYTSAAEYKLKNPDILFCPFSAVLLENRGVPVVSTFYDMQFRDYPDFFNKKERDERRANYERMVSLTDGIATISNYGRESILNRGEFPEDRVRTIYLQMAKRAELGIKEIQADLISLPSGRYLFYPANFWPHKNHKLLLVAFAMACQKGLPGDIHLALTGAEDERMNWLRMAVARMGLSQRIHFLGFLPDQQFFGVLKNSIALFFPSLYEGFGIPVVEAQAAGIPVACGRVASLPEVAGEAALFFDPRNPSEMAEAMIRIASDEELRKELIMQGHKNAQRFSDPRTMAKEYVEFFKEIAGWPRNKVRLNGQYPDNWAGRKMELVNYNPYSVLVQLEVLRPDWLPGRLWCGIKKVPWMPRLWKSVRPGKMLSIELVLGPSSKVSLKFSPCYNPKVAKANADSRDLSCLVVRCVVLVPGRKDQELTKKLGS